MFPVVVIMTKTTVPSSHSSRKGEWEQVPPKNILCRSSITLGGTQLFKVSHMEVGIFMTFPEKELFSTSFMRDG
jgi:hypothetical protein